MNKKEILVTCIIGGAILMVYIGALICGVQYNQLYGITIAQILYIMFVGIYGGIVLSRKAREEMELQKVPIKVKHEDNEYNEYEENLNNRN